MRKILFFFLLSFLIAQGVYSQNLPKRAIGGICNSRATYFPIPEFSKKTEENKFAESINVKIKIDKEGNVTSANAVSGSLHLRNEAQKMALKAKFKITRLSGVAVGIDCVIVYPVYQNEIIEQKTISLGRLNEKAKVLPMPITPTVQPRKKGSMTVSVKVDLTKGKVVSAKAKNGLSLLKKAAVEAALKAEFEPTLKNFPTVYGEGVLVYPYSDFNGPRSENRVPKPFPIIERKDKYLNEIALNYDEVRNSASVGCAGGDAEVAILVNSKGNVIFAKAVSGDSRLFEGIEKASLKVKFRPVSISVPVIVAGKLKYSFAVKRCSAGVVNGQAIYLPKPEVKIKLNKKEYVNVVVNVNESGDVVSAKAVVGHPLLRPAAESAARRAKFIPRKSKYKSFWTGVLVYLFEPIEASEKKKIIISHLNSKVIRLVKPNYTKAALVLGIKGKVSVDILVDEKGNVEEAKAVSGHPLLRSEAVRAAKLSKFQPTKLSGKPVRARSTIVYFYN